MRELLRKDGALRREYREVKKQVAMTAVDVDQYVQGKNDILQRILAVAGLSEAERESIHSANRNPPTRPPTE